jgi:signal-transduction protein with cAMP-binding, CBS, and nucleotidyltransferase domain
MTGFPQSEHPKEKIGDFMTTPVVSIDVKATIQEAAHMMDEENASAILTTENGNHVGIITERDFTRKVVGIITVKNTFSYYMNLFGLGSYDPTTSED